MKTHIITISGLMLAALLTGCSLFGGTTVQTPPTAEVVIQQPTAETVVEEPPSAPSVQAEEFYTEEFETGSPTEEFYGGWSNTYDEIQTYTENGKLWFNIDKDNWWYAISYDAYEYNNVKFTVNVESRTGNASSVILMCHLQWDVGRYEFNIGSNGLYEIYDVHYEDGVQAWDLIADGGTGKIKPGNTTNEYTVVCDGQDLALYVNGSEVWHGTVSTSFPQWYDGMIAFGATSHNGTPVTLGFESLTIEQP